MMVDDQGWGDTGYNGHPFVKTPYLDEMAKQRVVFDRFYSAATCMFSDARKCDDWGTPM